MKALELLAVAALTALAATSCGVDMDSHARAAFFGRVPDGRWLYSAPVEFNTDSLPDSVVSGPLVLTLRHSSVYPYRNIWLEVEQGRLRQVADTTVADSFRTVRVVSRDTFEIMLADPFGRWYGSGMGASLRRTDTVAPSYTLERGASLAVRHIMRVDTLPEVEQIGILIIDN